MVAGFSFLELSYVEIEEPYFVYARARNQLTLKFAPAWRLGKLPTMVIKSRSPGSFQSCYAVARLRLSG